MIAIICMLIRTIWAPNPFEPLGEIAVVLNLLFDGILHVPTFLMVGMIYDRGFFPALGSILYLIIYFVNSFALQGVMMLYPRWIYMIVAVVVYFVVYIKIASIIRE